MMRRLLKWLDVNFEPLTVTLIFFVMFALVTAQVIIRFIFKSGFSWGEEASRYLFVWLVFSGLSFAVRNNKHICTNFLRAMLDIHLQKAVMIIVDLLFLLFLGIIFKSSIDIVQTTAKFGDKGLTLPVSLNVLYSAALFGTSIMIIRGIQTLCWKIKRFKQPFELFSNEGGLQSGAEEIFFMPENLKTKDPGTSTWN